MIDNPGILFANLLLMGDGYDQTDNYMDYGYDNLYGAGRLRARKWDISGMDHPWEWATGWTCVGHGKVKTIPINGGYAIPWDINMMKAVIWWYDPRHDDDGTVDDIDISLFKTNGTWLAGSYSYHDNKERFIYDPSGLAVKLVIHGYSVTGDDTGCGSDSMKVFFAYYFEDTDRDDANGPGEEIDREWSKVNN